MPLLHAMAARLRSAGRHHPITRGGGRAEPCPSGRVRVDQGANSVPPQMLLMLCSLACHPSPRAVHSRAHSLARSVQKLLRAHPLAEQEQEQEQAARLYQQAAARSSRHPRAQSLAGAGAVRGAASGSTGGRGHELPGFTLLDAADGCAVQDISAAQWRLLLDVSAQVCAGLHLREPPAAPAPAPALPLPLLVLVLVLENAAKNGWLRTTMTTISSAG